jgi:hypothetical protein
MTSQPKFYTCYRVGVLTDKVLQSRGLKGISTQQLYIMAKNGAVPTHRVGDQDLIAHEDVKDIVERIVAQRLAKENGTDELLNELLADLVPEDVATEEVA